MGKFGSISNKLPILRFCKNFKNVQLLCQLLMYRSTTAKNYSSCNNPGDKVENFDNLFLYSICPYNVCTASKVDNINKRSEKY